MPEQEVNPDPAGGWRLEFRATLPCEDWNAQLSLLTGMAAARLMLDGGVGLLRTLPPPWPSAVASLRRSALALRRRRGRDDAAYHEVVRGLDGSKPVEAAILALATVLLRGAGYVAFDGAPPEQPLHSAVAAPYAHATAPLRRLADRYVSEVCLSLCAGVPVPAWAREQLPSLPALMGAADHRSHELERAMIDLAEAVTLSGRVGEVFRGDGRRGPRGPRRPPGPVDRPADGASGTGPVQRWAAARPARCGCAWSPPTPTPVPSRSIPPELF